MAVGWWQGIGYSTRAKRRRRSDSLRTQPQVLNDPAGGDAAAEGPLLLLVGMAAATSAPPPPQLYNDDFALDSPRHNSHAMARDDDHTMHHSSEDLLDKMVSETSSPAPVTSDNSNGGDNYTVERPRATTEWNSNTPYNNNNNSISSPGTQNKHPVHPVKKPSRLNLKMKGKLSVQPPSQEDLHDRWAEMQDPHSVINSEGFKAEHSSHKEGLYESPPASAFARTSFTEEEMTPRYVEPAPRALVYETLVRDFAYPTHHILHNGADFQLHDSDDDEDVPSCSPLSATAPHFIPGRTSDIPGPHRDFHTTTRRLSDSAESSTAGGNSLNGGAPKWTPGPWGGDGAMLYEDMQPLPSTSFAPTSNEQDESGIVWNSKQQSHRKSRSFADVPSYERGRRRGDTGSGSKRGSWQPRENSRGAAFSDPAGREALRTSRGITAAEEAYRNLVTAATTTAEPESVGEEDDDMYALNFPPHVPQQGPTSRRDSHIAYRTFRPDSRPRRFSDDPTFDDPLPLDSLENTTESSPKRESIGPDDEELYAGPSLALYDFHPENENELGLFEGQVVLVSYRHGLGWLVAENEEGERGLVPEEYVRLLRDIEGWEGSGWRK